MHHAKRCANGLSDVGSGYSGVYGSFSPLLWCPICCGRNLTASDATSLDGRRSVRRLLSMPAAGWMRESEFQRQIALGAVSTALQERNRLILQGIL